MRMLGLGLDKQPRQACPRPMLVSLAFQVPVIQLGTQKTISVLGLHIDEVISDVIMGDSLATFCKGDHTIYEQYYIYPFSDTYQHCLPFYKINFLSFLKLLYN